MKKILVIIAGLALSGANVYAANGDLVVNGNLTVEGTVNGNIISVTPEANTVPVRDSKKDIAVSDGTNLIHTKIIDIGDWDMDATASVSIQHGLAVSKIRSVSVLIRNDSTVPYDFWLPRGQVAGYTVIDSAQIHLYRAAAPGFFDNMTFNATLFNRGWVTIIYIE